MAVGNGRLSELNIRSHNGLLRPVSRKWNLDARAFVGSSWNRETLAGPYCQGAAARRTRVDHGLSLFVLRVGRLRLPPSPDLLDLWRGGNRPLRPVGGRLDDAGPPLPMSSFRDLRARFRPIRAAAPLALVSAMALRPLARNQSGTGCQSAAAVARMEARPPISGLSEIGILGTQSGPPWARPPRIFASASKMRVNALWLHPGYRASRSSRRGASLDPSSAARSYRLPLSTSSRLTDGSWAADAGARSRCPATAVGRSPRRSWQQRMDGKACSKHRCGQYANYLKWPRGPPQTSPHAHPVCSGSHAHTTQHTQRVADPTRLLTLTIRFTCANVELAAPPCGRANCSLGNLSSP
jgi:hypothetical protein